ncbi:putative DNA-binding domain-containing protein [Paucibacter sp. APW11]|uniref:DNA-binding domain-containing protein n=1 Tax=Roseateles aquae TaxID=3077235 RepID=A0ABU3P836_9BURK|nr:putative DNA-binding domain-containing protein [Paucibacter sp. APW11]MDT8998736.1 putative DNA-binding domain-containing protein [Paucibacter sp. APW11]
MSELELQRQAGLVQALLNREAEPALIGQLRALPGIAATDGRLRGLTAYRLNAAAVAERSLAAVFVQLRRQFSDEDFAAMAWAFWRWRPPVRGDLACWGQDLPEFLAAQPDVPAGWPGVAALEWALHQAERATDASLDAASLQLLQQHGADQLGLRMRPGLQVLQLDEQALALVDEGGEQPPASESYGVLVWRCQWRGRWRRLDAAEQQCYAALLAGASLQQALDHALALDADFDFTAWFQQALLDECLAGATLLAEPKG